MPKPSKGPRLGGGPAHERLLLANLAAALFTHKAITTTETKAKRVQPLADRLVTFAKRGDLHARRRVLATIGDKSVVHELFTELAPLVARIPGVRLPAAFDADAIRALAESHRTGRADHGRTLWQLLMLERSVSRLFRTGTA